MPTPAPSPSARCACRRPAASAASRPQPAERALIAAAEAALLDERRLLDRDELAALAALPDGAVVALAALAHQVRLAWCGPRSRSRASCRPRPAAAPRTATSAPSRPASTPRSRPPRSSTPTRCWPRPGRRPRSGRRSSASCWPSGAPTSAPCTGCSSWSRWCATETGLNVAVSAGILTEDQAGRLAAGGVHRYNHNLETARSFFRAMVTTHTWEERVETCRLVGARHGAVLRRPARHGRVRRPAGRAARPAARARPGRGAGQLLEPPPGHAARRPAVVGAWEAVRWIALFRLALPGVILRYAGGREVTLRDLQAMGMTAGINALIVGNYLTTLGRSPAEDLQCWPTCGCPSAPSPPPSEPAGDRRRLRARSDHQPTAPAVAALTTAPAAGPRSTRPGLPRMRPPPGRHGDPDGLGGPLPRPRRAASRFLPDRRPAPACLTGRRADPRARCATIGHGHHRRRRYHVRPLRHGC